MNAPCWILSLPLALVGCTSDKGEGGKNKVKTLSSIEKTSIKKPGLFDLYQHKKTGKLLFAVKKGQLGRQYLYYRYVNDASVSKYHRGKILKPQVIKIEKNFGHLLIKAMNTGYYFDKNSELSKSSGANISNALLSRAKIVGKDEDGEVFLVDGNKLFLTESLGQVKPSLDPKDERKRRPLGKLNKDRSHIVRLANFPKNTNVSVDYIYFEDNPYGQTRQDMVDPRYQSIKMEHILTEMPPPGFKPRLSDPRVGYFHYRIDDQTSTSSTPYRDLIKRWRIEKSDPTEPVSKVKSPIVWWIENTTPKELRPVISSGILEWNKAFEAAGFKGVLEVREQPDDAKWDAADLRYNVIRFMSSPRPRFGGYGPHYSNPLTGEIIGADIVLEFVHFTRRVQYLKLFGEDKTQHHESYPQSCGLGMDIQELTYLGSIVSQMGSAPGELKQMQQEALKLLTMHEVGHTLGLSHNMMASQMNDPASLHDVNLTKERGIVGSVMDYDSINLAAGDETQGEYYSSTIGPYDRWAIQFGYFQTSGDATKDQLIRNEILRKSVLPEHAFGNDADDMRTAGGGIDPRIMTGDLSNDALTWAQKRLEILINVFKELPQKYRSPGQSYQEFRVAYYILFKQYRKMLEIVSRYIGGVYSGPMIQKTAPQAVMPLSPVSLEDQKRAISILGDYLFRSRVFAPVLELSGMLQLQRRGFDLRRKRQDPPLHGDIGGMVQRVFNHLFHRNTLARINDSQFYGNGLSMFKAMDLLSAAIFRSADDTEVLSVKNLIQIEFVKHLSRIVKSKNGSYPSESVSSALFHIREIRQLSMKNLIETFDPLRRSHWERIVWMTERIIQPISDSKG